MNTGNLFCADLPHLRRSGSMRMTPIGYRPHAMHGRRAPVGERLFLAPPWSEETVPDGRVRLIHNPGLACGTGEHPCTQMALAAMERIVKPGDRVADIGTGSGILAIGAALLKAGQLSLLTKTKLHFGQRTRITC